MSTTRQPDMAWLIGFGGMTPGFKYVAFNAPEGFAGAVADSTIAVRSRTGKQNNKSVGLSNILDSKPVRRKPEKGPHREAVGTAAVSRRVGRFLLLLAKRLVNAKLLSVWTHSSRMPRRAYYLTGLFRKSAEEKADCSGQVMGRQGLDL